MNNGQDEEIIAHQTSEGEPDEGMRNPSFERLVDKSELTGDNAPALPPEED